MPSSPALRRCPVALTALLLTALPHTARAQADSAAGDSRLAGRVRVALDAGTERLDHGVITQYAVSPAAYPFVSEHLQVGLAPSYTLLTGAQQPTYHGYGASGTVNYVVGSGARWRGYAGGYASTATSRTDAFTAPDPVEGPRTFPAFSTTRRTIGLQAGVLYFLAPALGIRAGVNYRASTALPFSQGSVSSFVTLEPYLVFGRGGASAPAAAGFGVVDVAGDVGRFDVPVTRYHQWSGSVRVAPYLTRWAQLGVSASGFRFTDFGGGGAYVARGFGRLYLPLTVRTQPYAEGFLQTGTYSDLEDGRLAGGTLGVRQMLNTHVALDVGVQRRVLPRAQSPDGVPYRSPGQTGLVIGLATRVGHSVGTR